MTIDYDGWANELQNSKLDLIEVLQQYMGLVEENKKLKTNVSTKEVDSIKESVSYLLEADLREENGWTKEEIKKLENLIDKDFEIRWK